MTFLEFIRKNLIIAVIVIVGILVGLIMMDYGDSGSAFSREYRVEINGTKYNAQDTASLGYNGRGYLESLARMSNNAAMEMCRKNADADGDGKLNEQEEMMYRIQVAYLFSMPTSAYMKPQYLLSLWMETGVMKNSPEENLAVNRLLIREEAKALGIKPSREQIDEYIKTLPAFQKNGAFNLEAYKTIVHYRNGQADNTSEQAFRELVSDMILWDTLYSIHTSGVTDVAEAASKINAAREQVLKGVSAWLPLSAVQQPADPTADEVKAYWELNKDKYQSEETRGITLITLIPGEGMNEEQLYAIAAEIRDSLTASPNADPEAIINTAIQNNEVTSAPFSYEKKTLPACSLATAPQELETIISVGGTATPLKQIAFSTDLTAKGSSRYSNFNLTDNKRFVMLQVDSITPASALPFEQAADLARADLMSTMKTAALDKAAEELYNKINAELAAGKDMKTAFAVAEAAGAQVAEFGPKSIAEAADGTKGIYESDLRRTPTGKLADVAKTTEGVAITGITERVVNTDPQQEAQRAALNNMALRLMLMEEWLRSAYTRYSVGVPKADDGE
ncbi:MAG: peptidylprolyl isomerase [Akkermansia sp.]|nr:peptidylprolyl isomerase [Akkermansia sp.]